MGGGGCDPLWSPWFRRHWNLKRVAHILYRKRGAFILAGICNKFHVALDFQVKHFKKCIKYKGFLLYATFGTEKKSH